MSEKEFNTDDLGEDSLSSMLGRTRRNRRPSETVKDEEGGDDGYNPSPSKKENNVGDGDDSHSSDVKDDGRKRMRITMLGSTGSGKTSFLSGVYQTMMANSYQGLSLVPSGNVDQAFEQIGQIADIALISRPNYDFADGTLEPTIFPLTLQRENKDICDFDFMDYAGGDVKGMAPRKKGEAITPQARVLRNQLLASDAILVFVDALLLCQGHNKEDWEKATGADLINSFFKILVREIGSRPLTVLFILTKTDDERIPASMKKNNFASLTERAIQAFGGVYDSVQWNISKGWSFGVIPVSAIGEGNYKLCAMTDAEGKEIQRPVVREGRSPKPYNIETTMLYAIACILSQWKRNSDAEKADLTERLIEEGRSNTFLGNIFSVWKKMPKPEDKVAGILREIEDKDRNIMELGRHINSLIRQTGVRNKVQRQQDHLEDDGEA